ncbi:hypothetical protein FisN_2Hu342 [Fistulifera solaris]|uniref:DUF6824 domain-containing protein n=1 Tax=Fistulifera solaris TaxID=1519565 RepID=A0A1Z5KL08_FISSO|nr:hypothetical protein FisN_2Hu342 [Fistulifera solaris]|eukprot:GAX26711.1 hypothetical protein FisN_2Hu342 [Fistulifera solaris]
MKEKMRLQDRWRQASERCQHIETARASGSTTVVHQMDVVFGSDPETSSDHIGNIQFHHLVEYNKSIWQALPKRNRILVARSIVDTIMRSGGRFLSQESICVKDRNVAHWTVMSYGEAILKTMDALSESSRSIVFAPLGRLRNDEMNDKPPIHSFTKSLANGPIAKEKERESSTVWRSMQDNFTKSDYDCAEVSSEIGGKGRAAAASKGKYATFRPLKLQSRYQGPTYADNNIAKTLVSSEILSSSSTETTSESTCSEDSPESSSEHDQATRSNIWRFGSFNVASFRTGLKKVNRVARQPFRSKRLHPIVKLHETGSSTVLSGSW